jgi:hypothetical protein
MVSLNLRPDITYSRLSVMPPKIKAVFSDEKNPRGIPKAPFIVRVSTLYVEVFLVSTLWSQTDVQEYLGAEADAETTLKSFQDALAYGLFLSYFNEILILSESAASTATWIQV